MNDAKLILYGYFRSSATWRVRIGLAWKGLAWETVPVHLVRSGGEQNGEEHRHRNAMAQVPVLSVDGTLLTQSVAILEYLEERWPTPPLLPSDPIARARVRQMVEIVNSGIQPLQNLAVGKRLEADHGVDKAGVARWNTFWIAKGLDALEAAAREHAGRCLVGDAVSFADACLVPQLFNARRFGVSLEPYPTLMAVESTLSALPAFIDSHPSRQPDAE